MSPLLAVEDVTVVFGGNTAVDGFGLTVQATERVGLIGPNGAGKSTVINVIAGTIRPTTGRVTFRDEDVGTERAHRRAQRGLARTFQDLQLFSQLTVLDNVLAALDARPDGPRRGARAAAARTLLDEVGIADSADRLVSVLPYGIRKLTELARALAMEPRLLLLDEPAAGLDAAEKRDFVGILHRSLTDRDTALVVVEHDMPTVEALADDVYVLDAGRVIARGPFATVSRDPKVIEAYLGPR